MTELTFADTRPSGIEAQLRTIWHRCFGDTDAYMDLFFTSRYVPHNAAVALEDNKAVAMLFLLPCRIAAGAAAIKADYLYAAATHPDYQGRGIMSKLMGFAAEQVRLRGSAAIALAPASRSLFSFYAKLGYKAAFRRKKVVFSREELKSMEISAAKEKNLTDRELAALRDSYYGARNGNLLWDLEAVSYARRECVLTGGKAIGFTSDLADGYALCRAFAGAVDVLELGATPASLPCAAAVLLRAFQANTFAFYLPADFQAAGDKTLPQDAGMLLETGLVPPLEIDADAYLGLTLE